MSVLERSLLRLLSVLVVAACGGADGPTPPRVPEPVDPTPVGPAQMVWEDTFEGTSLDTTRWRHRRLGPRRDGINAADAVAVANGNLLLVTHVANGNVHVPMIGTEPTFQRAFGYYEARIRFPKQQGHWFGFWLQSPDIDKTGNNPRVNGVEIDIIEYMANHPTRAWTHIHWDGYGASHKKRGKPYTEVSGLDEDYHLVGLDWTPFGYTWYVNREAIWTNNEAVSQRHQYIILSHETERTGWAGTRDVALFPDTTYVDWVRVWDKRPF